MNSLIVKLIVGGVVAVAGIVGVAQGLMAGNAPKASLPASATSLTTKEADVPSGLQERMNAMVAAIEAGDVQAYAANYNMDYLYRLVKGEVEYDENLFGGTAEDAQRLQQNLSGIASPEALADAFAQSVNFQNIAAVSLESIKISEDGTHATAKLVQTKTGHGKVITSPQWHYFDNAWWQIDD
ncbi:MAG: hypothetical protein JSW27_03375 [Phycisphaerales bacterium]|nr:MAG: hypothetical protein JSW27_03375 [Phycisphaerales bacterium]